MPPSPASSKSPVPKTAVSKSSKTRPLLVREGARYTCFGDGLCCSDLHGLGPLTRAEVKDLERISLDVVARADETGFDEPMLKTREDGYCLFRTQDRCELHASLGEPAKPEGCRRFPYGLTATPLGGRVTTWHRCPCRTLGDRPEITAEGAQGSLVDGRGRLSADRRIDGRVPLAPRKSVAFSTWATQEEGLLSRLRSGETPESVLDAPSFPALEGLSWASEAAEMLEDGVDGSRFGVALEWFAHGIRVLHLGKKFAPSELPWGDAFDRAQTRSTAVGVPEEMFADWLSDEIWAMRWVESAKHFQRARAEWATRLAIGRYLAGRIELAGTRADRAAAEAISIIDLIGDSEWWTDIVDAIK